ncbi:unnamed protein product [Amoebophrya sp. A120]|nr:unnamed protein product [Amoebophrya sp. A120]|eukprot:GSA120T00015795001.1
MATAITICSGGPVRMIGLERGGSCCAASLLKLHIAPCLTGTSAAASSTSTKQHRPRWTNHPRFFSTATGTSTEKHQAASATATSGAAADHAASKNAKTVAIVGSGPAGFYTAKFLLRRNTPAAAPGSTNKGKEGNTASSDRMIKPQINIHMFDQFPTPFGLVRYGVAPDHPEVKNVINDFEEVVEKNKQHFKYFGNVWVGDMLRTSHAKTKTAINREDFSCERTGNTKDNGAPDDFNVIQNTLVSIFDRVYTTFFPSSTDHAAKSSTSSESSTITGTSATPSSAANKINPHDNKDKLVLPLSQLRENYDAVVLATGAQFGKTSIPGSVDAYSFVQEYNGFPVESESTSEKSPVPPTASSSSSQKIGSKIVINGLGNVALDVARMLLSPKAPQVIHSDIIEETRDAIEKSNVAHVIITGRRGAVQNQFGTKELRELLHADPSLFTTVIDPVDFQNSMDETSKQELGKSKMKQRQMKILEEMVKNWESLSVKDSEPVGTREKPILQLKFLTQPVDFDKSKNELKYLKTKLVVKEMETTSDPAVVKAVPASDELVLKGVDRVFESVGFGFEPFDKELVPYHVNTAATVSEEKSSVEQDTTRVGADVAAVAEVPPRPLDLGPLKNNKGHVFDNVFCAGWLKRGPRGTIASNVPDAAETSGHVLAYLDRNETTATSSRMTKTGPVHPAEASQVGTSMVDGPVTDFDDWLRLKAVEEEEGKKVEKLAVKITSIAEMMEKIRMKA